MRGNLVIGEFRVQPIYRAGNRESFTIVWPDGSIHEEADRYLTMHEGSGSQRTYAYYLVDHLRWREREGLRTDTIELRDLLRYMGAVGAEVPMLLGRPWRVPPKKLYTQAALEVAAACLKAFYLYQCALGVNPVLKTALDVRRLPSRADRNRAFLGHVMSSAPTNPLVRRTSRRRHPKMLPEDAREPLLEAVNTARDRMILTWLADGGMRVGELTGLHLVDLHLREGAACSECRPAHLHVCHRPGNVNRAAAKTKEPWAVRDGIVVGGLIKRVSPAMIHTYFEYMTTEYPATGDDHGMLLVQLANGVGAPLSADGVRGMLRRAGARAGFAARIKPHAFRHTLTTAVMDVTGGNAMVAKEVGGWASVQSVEETYGHPDLNDPVFGAALQAVWGQQ